MRPREVCGQLLIGGFSGHSLPEGRARALRDGRLGGAILFRRNVPEDVCGIAVLCHAIATCHPTDCPPPLVGVDQEGGRVQRLGPPFLQLPPARALADTGNEVLVEEVVRAASEQLVELGFTMNFAPVLDVNTNPENPIIGDRAYGDEPKRAIQFALAALRGMKRAGLLSCGKHFPGHGDTSLDSHLALPSVDRTIEKLWELELPPFRAAIEGGVDALMTAHVLYPALEPGVPATLSRRSSTDLVRSQMGFRGVLISDDLEMRAIADHFGMAEAAVSAVRAGCDALLICSKEDAQDEVFEALVHAAEGDSSFAARCEEACRRVFAMRRRVSPKVLPMDEIRRSLSSDRALQMRERLASLSSAARGAQSHGVDLG